MARIHYTAARTAASLKMTLAIAEDNHVLATCLDRPALQAIAPTAKQAMDELVALRAATPSETDDRRRSVVPLRYKRQYKPMGDTCGDAMAEALKANVQDDKGKVDMAALIAVGFQNDIGVTERWGHLNPGMQRMNLGNCLLDFLGLDADVRIGATTFAGIQAEEVEQEQQAA